jgi:NAD(P)-dependent dehydrogenase (short-subunit alcohol dehydrogenase family)
MKIRKVLVTGSAGFVGNHLSQQLLSLGFNVVGRSSKGKNKLDVTDINQLHSTNSRGIEGASCCKDICQQCIEGPLSGILYQHSGYIKCTRVLQVEEYQKIDFYELIRLWPTEVLAYR